MGARDQRAHMLKPQVLSNNRDCRFSPGERAKQRRMNRETTAGEDGERLQQGRMDRETTAGEGGQRDYSGEDGQRLQQGRFPGVALWALQEELGFISKYQNQFEITFKKKIRSWAWCHRLLIPAAEVEGSQVERQPGI